MKSAMKTYIKQREKESNIKESIEDMENWNQKFGNIFSGSLSLLFVIATIMFFFGCEISLKTEEAAEEEKVEEDSTSSVKFNASDWIIFR
jgi:Na+/H+ antiporter NhaC